MSSQVGANQQQKKSFVEAWKQGSRPRRELLLLSAPWVADVLKVADLYKIKVMFFRDRVKGDGWHTFSSGKEALRLKPKAVAYQYMIDDSDWKDAVRLGPQQLLHEIAHIVTYRPGTDLNLVPEGLMLLQYERAVAQYLWGKRRPNLVRQVVDFQQDHIFDGGSYNTVSSMNLSPRCIMWCDGLDRCRHVGLLDEKNRPTFKKADWSKYPLDQYENDIKILRE